MPRKIIVVTTAYGHDYFHAQGGQIAVLPIIANAGADGVEIRRELLSDEELAHLPSLAFAVEVNNLLACYSAPEPLCLADGALNPCLPALLEETRLLNALWLKVSLGHFQDSSVLATLGDWLASSGVALVVENDQTACGTLAAMQRFQAACQAQALPVTLTFDTGNWLWAGDAPEQAARQLAPAVSYIHVKAAVADGERFRAVPPDQADPRWLALLNALPADAPRGIEFPLTGDSPIDVTRYYVNLLREEPRHA
ncbi:Sugar phosphate isomerase/epimerase [Kosakonia oryzendophytica]|uniref:Sugar phosphate isomerase/epimerase n=1 Tax=Kosakonia oryzendophytica TaxID=1005665 RepID=A0A1C4BYV4_9ENTR|nr:TIM barrel protein [Kosakonia oryzendophytica]SCC11988.1 Sugar phosphate isomerase/epimerase [Kosakonia oryzendophytica]